MNEDPALDHDSFGEPSLSEAEPEELPEDPALVDDYDLDDPEALADLAEEESPDEYGFDDPAAVDDVDIPGFDELE